MRAETITRANACLVQAQRDIPLAQVWGGGYVASVDGLRFVVPVRSVNTGPNPRYFGQGRGVTYLNYTSDQFTGLGGLVIAGTIRDSVYLLEALLEQESGLTPTEIMSDSASYSDLMFGLFWCLGYQFSGLQSQMSIYDTTRSLEDLTRERTFQAETPSSQSA